MPDIDNVAPMRSRSDLARIGCDKLMAMRSAANHVNIAARNPVPPTGLREKGAPIGRSTGRRCRNSPPIEIG